MKILGICGSLRVDGNSEWMVRTVLEAAKNVGAQVDIILLKDLNVRYCTGCDACHGNGGNCVLDDDMQRVYPKLLEANIIVVGSPNYFKNVSALTKNFIDRTNAFVRVKPRKLEGKYALGLCVGGEELEDTQHCEDALVRFFRGHKMKILSMVKAKGDEKGSVALNSELEKKLVDIGKKIAEGDFTGLASYR